MINGVNRRIIVADRLLPSTQDMVELGHAVHIRFLEVCTTYFRVNRIELVPPPDLNSAMLRWRQMCVRHSLSDFRNTESEKKATEAVAQWTVNVNLKIKGQKPIALDWNWIN